MAISKAIGADRMGFRMSPWSNAQGMRMKDPVPQFTNLIRSLRDLKLAYLHAIESRVSGNIDCPENGSLDFVSEAWKNNHGGVLIVNGGYNLDTANAAINGEYLDLDTAVGFGRHFLANPDLPFRIRHRLELNKYRREFFYVPEEQEGYADYPFCREFVEGRINARNSLSEATEKGTL
jgi:2,4-dienoyl-CoA reductase-like NADH-dependent reductase (Old Yellow Enzyme family)